MNNIQKIMQIINTAPKDAKILIINYGNEQEELYLKSELAGGRYNNIITEKDKKENCASIIVALGFQAPENLQSASNISKLLDYEGYAIISANIGTDEYFLKESAILREFGDSCFKIITEKPRTWKDKIKSLLYGSQRDFIYVFCNKKPGKIYDALKRSQNK